VAGLEVVHLEAGHGALHPATQQHLPRLLKKLLHLAGTLQSLLLLLLQGPSTRLASISPTVLPLGKSVACVHLTTNESLTFSYSDPWPASVILWTRVAPTLVSDRSNITVNGTAPLYNHDTEEYIAASVHPICVEYVVTSDPGLKQVVDKGTAYTTSDIDYTVKVLFIQSFSACLLTYI